MGGLGSMLGLAGGVQGSGVSGPSQAQIINPVTTGQSQEQYNNANNALNQQQAFLDAVKAQNGLGNQSAVFNQLQGVTNGTGPNPAQAQLAQATGQNVANQAALMAGQRGSSANVGLIARQASQQGGGLQQQAAGQAATLQANQSLNALNSMGNLATNQANQQAGAVSGYNQAAQGEQGQILNAIQGVNNATVGSQQSVNQGNTGIIASSQKSQAGLIAGAGQALALADGGVVPPQQAPSSQIAVSTPGPSNATPQPKSSYAKVIAGALGNTNGPSSESMDSSQALGSMFGSGLKKGYNAIFGGSDEQPDGMPAPSLQDHIAQQQFNTSQEGVDLENAAMKSSASSLMPDLSSMAGFMAARGGMVPAMVSPGEQYLPPQDVKKVVKDGKDPLATGERIPGKPKVKGNSYANDTVPKTLEAGGIVIPNSIMQSKNPSKEAAKFVAAHCRNLSKGKK